MRQRQGLRGLAVRAHAPLQPRLLQARGTFRRDGFHALPFSAVPAAPQVISKG